MKEPFDQILQILQDSNVEFEHITHDKAITSMDTVKATGFDIKNGAKSILFKDKNAFKLVIVRGDNRADFKKLRKHFGTNKLRMATPDEVLSIMSVEVGACYPFGEIAGVEMIVDEMINEIKRMHFSPGTHFDHIEMAVNDYKKVTQTKFVDIARDD